MSAVLASQGTAGLAPAVIGKQAFDRQRASYLFAAVRADLPKSVQGVQICHAVAQAAACGGLTSDTRFVLTVVPDQAALFALARRLADDGLSPCVFEEPDYDIGASALALPPGPVRQGRRLSHLPLWSVE